MTHKEFDKLSVSKQLEYLLFLTWAQCDKEDKSTEYMLALMADAPSMDYDKVVDFIANSSDEKRDKWYADNPNWYENLIES